MMQKIVRKIDGSRKWRGSGGGEGETKRRKEKYSKKRLILRVFTVYKIR